MHIVIIINACEKLYIGQKKEMSITEFPFVVWFWYGCVHDTVYQAWKGYKTLSTTPTPTDGQYLCKSFEAG